MTEKFLDKYRIQSTRKPNWNYSSSGWYFVTICTYHRIKWFGDVYDKKMHLNELGKIAQQFWLDIPKHFLNVKLGKFIIMPNHIHGIIDMNEMPPTQCRDAINRVSTGGITKLTNPMILNNSLGAIIRWFKGRTSFEIRKIQKTFQWQPNYHDQIIRNEFEYSAKVEYILNNPVRWNEDRNNPKNIKSDIITTERNLILARLLRGRSENHPFFVIPAEAGIQKLN